ncbi:MAG TPA: 4Fe-4S dicluster domain-containing protein [Cytophagaceae bacterium]
MAKGANNTYFGDILEGITSLWEGLKVTFRHFIDARKKRPAIGVEDASYFNYDVGVVTTEYPKEAIPVPDNGRYRLHNEIDDCIVCDLCAKICPVNCIEIEAVKSTEEIGKTSDGTTKRLYAAKFDIDMAKCCYCGLCTTVCPTECLTMTKTYDYSEYDISNMIYHFTNLTPEEAEERKKLYEESIRLKELEREKQKAAKAAATEASTEEAKAEGEKKEVKKAPFKPVIKAPSQPSATTEESKTEASAGAVKKPVIKPVIKSKTQAAEGEDKKEEAEESKPAAKPKPVIKPVIKPRTVTNETSEPDSKSQEVTPKPKPIIKPVIKAKKEENTEEGSKEKSEDASAEQPKPKPVIKPVIKPRIPKKDSE